MSGENRTFWLGRDELTPSNLRSLVDAMEANGVTINTGEIDPPGNPVEFVDRETLAVSSLVELKGGERMHMLLLDLAGNEGDPRRQIDCIKGLGLVGYLLDSGNGEHFWGTRLLSPDGWNRVMDSATRFEQAIRLRDEEPVFDLGFLEHSTQRGFSALRLFDDDTRPEPEVVAIIR